jgi:YbbR domain-containing protein
MKHLGLRLLSVVIALLLWLFVNSESNITSARIPVSVDVRDLPSNRMVLWQLKKQVEVEVRGPSFLVNRLVTTPPTVRLKIPESVETKFTAQITRNELGIEPPLQVLSIEPSTVSFSVEKKLGKELQIKVPLIGQVPGDFQLEQVSTSPATIVLTGPESEIKDLTYVQTVPVDLREVRDTFTDEVSLRMPGKLVESNQPFVRVKVSVAPMNARRAFDDVPIEVRQSGESAVVMSPRIVKVTVVSTQSKIRELRESEILPFVKVPAQLDERGVSVPVQVELPAGYKLGSLTPEKILVRAGAGLKSPSKNPKR